MSFAFVPAVPVTSQPRRLSVRLAQSHIRSSQFCPTLSPHPEEVNNRTSRVTRSTAKASLSTSFSILASVFPLVLFPSNAPPSTQFKSPPQHVGNARIIRTPAQSSSSVHAPLALVSPVRATESPDDDTKGALKPASTTTIRQRFSFYLSEFLMWHPGAKVLALLGFTLVAIYLGSFLYRFADPKHEEAPYPFWHAVRAVANPLEDDWQKNSLRITSITLASFGMVVFAILVGMVTDSVQTAVENADGENTHVVLSNHVVVCGWSKYVAQILKDVSSVSPNTKVVVLAPAGKKAMMQSDIRSILPDKTKQNFRIYYRPGVPTVHQDLERVGAARARKIILVKPQCVDPIDADRVTLSRALALRQNLPSFKGDIVAELSTTRDEMLVRSILSSSHARSVQTVNTEQLLFRFMAQAIRQPGLADIVSMLMSNDPTSVFHVLPVSDAAPELVGKKFEDLRPSSIPGAILCGFVDSSGQVVIENGASFTQGGTVSPNSKLLLLGRGETLQQKANDRNECQVSQLSATTSSMMRTVLGESVTDGPTRYISNQPENFLVLGWRHDMSAMLSELDTILPRGSTVTIVDKNIPGRLSVPTKRIKVTLIQKRSDRYETVNELVLGKRARKFNHVVVIGSRGNSGAEASELDSHMGIDDGEDDAKSLATLVYVNDVIGKLNGKTPLLTVEFLNEDVADMAKEQGGIANAILPQNIGAKIAAQTVRDNRLNAVWKELLSQVGREVYLRPAGMYTDVGGKQASFANIADRIARSHDDIVIGYIPKFISKVRINPQGNERVSARMWNEGDTLIVLSKE